MVSKIPLLTKRNQNSLEEKLPPDQGLDIQKIRIGHLTVTQISETIKTLCQGLCQKDKGARDITNATD